MSEPGKQKVLVAMSGGIDSTVTALMLHRAGYEVIGITMKTWDYASAGAGKKETGCCNLDSFNDARLAAVQNGFPHYVLDIRDEFGDAVSDFIATGHYANVREENGRWVISKGLDSTKDQSYVLWGLDQAVLSRTLLPLGNYRKTEIRQMAEDFGYPELAKKSESYEICFVPDNDYRGFLKRKVSGLEEKVDGGNFTDIRGNILGKHKGYPFYTIGQRKGLEIAFGKPVYVIEIIPETNTVVLGDESDLNRSEMVVRKMNWLKYEGVSSGMEVVAKIRYKDPGTPAHLFPEEDGSITVHFFDDAKGVAPGQSAVFYEGDDVIGGGIIQRKVVEAPFQTGMSTGVPGTLSGGERKMTGQINEKSAML